MIPRFRPYLSAPALAAVLLPAPEDAVAAFEREFAAAMQQKHAVAFSYGRTGLALLLQAMGFKGREILCPAYTCVVVANAIVLSGNIPVFVDCAPDSFNLDLDQADALVTPRTAAMVPTSVFGYPVNLDRLSQFRQTHPHVAVIQDCAHAFAAEYNGRPVQTEADASLFGLGISKHITSVFGGMITTDRDDLADRLRSLRTRNVRPPRFSTGMRRRLYLAAVAPAFHPLLYGITNLVERTGMLDKHIQGYSDGVIDLPHDAWTGMTDIEARVGGIQLRKYPQLIDRKRRIAHRYDRDLANASALRRPPLVDGATYSHYVCLVDNRDFWMRGARTRGIQLGSIIDYSIPDMTAFRPYRREPCPIASFYAAHALNLPIWPGVERYQPRIIRVLHHLNASAS